MGTAVAAIDYLNLGLYLLAGAAALRVWRRSGSRAGSWSAAAFGALAVIVVVGRVLPDDPAGAAAVVQRLLIALLVLFPYLLYRFTNAFEEATRPIERLVGLLTAAMLVWTFALPSVPGASDPRPAWFWAYVAAFLAHWTLLTSVSSRLLWRAGRGQPGVARHRMRLLSVATVVITVALFLAIPGGSRDSVLALVAAIVSTLSAVAFTAALDPPPVLRMLWRRPEQERLQEAIGELMLARDEQEVARRVLPPMARIVGASALTLVSGGQVLGSYPDGETARPLTAGDPEVRTVDVDGTALLVRTSRHAPFFGTDELELLATLGAMTSLALDHARLLAGEREARAALERADELKTQFVAFAAHELRNPIATVVGLVETLELRESELSPELTAELKATLGEQARRTRALVEQLLDLSRLDAEAVEIHAEPVAVRARVEQIVDVVGGGVELAIEPALAAELDTAAFDHIVTNLVTNALRYGATPIVVRASQSDRHFRLTVEDDGPGVPPAFVPQLFERFARADEARHVAGGSGLGLAIARSYARAHQGDLVYEPRRQGGARFELVLPRRQPPSADGG